MFQLHVPLSASVKKDMKKAHDNYQIRNVPNRFAFSSDITNVFSSCIGLIDWSAC